MSPTNSRPLTAKATWSTSLSHENETIPAAPSRARSRRARSCADSCSVFELLSSERTSARHVSVLRSVWHIHNELTESLPTGDLRNSTRFPSGETTMFRGSPRVRRWVRAYCRGNVSVMRAVFPNHQVEQERQPIRVRTFQLPIAGHLMLPKRDANRGG